MAAVWHSTLDYSDVIEAYLLEMERRRGAAAAADDDDVVASAGTFGMTQLHHVLADLFGAGTDTTMTTIQWVLLYMILHPDVQVVYLIIAFYLVFLALTGFNWVLLGFHRV